MAVFDWSYGQRCVHICGMQVQNTLYFDRIAQLRAYTELDAFSNSRLLPFINIY